MTRKFLLVFYALTFFVTMGMGTAQAVSVGKIEVASHLGEPFYAEVPLLLENEEVVSNVSVDVAGSEDYRVLEVYRDPVLKQIKTWLKTDKRGTRVEINSNSNIETPFFNLVLKVRYNSATHFKKYVVFLELPTASKSPRVADISRGAPAAASTPSASLTQGQKLVAVPAPSQQAASAMNAKSTAMKAVRQDPSASRAQGWARTARYGPMVRGDTVTTVAQRLRIDDTFTNAQVMIALFEKNRDKFGEGNINLIKAGTFLEVPSAEEVARHSSSEASKILVSQNVQWKKLVKKPKYADIAKAQKNRYRPHVRLGKAGSGVAVKTIKASEKNDAKTIAKPAAGAKLAAKKSAAEKAATSGNSNQGQAAAATKASEALALENKQLKDKLATMESQVKVAQSAELAALEARNKKLELQIIRLQAQLDGMKNGGPSANQAVAKAAEVKEAEVKAAEVKAAEVKAAEVKAAEVKAAEVKAAEVKAAASVSGPAPAVAPVKADAAKPVDKPAPVAASATEEPAVTEAETEGDGEPTLIFGFPLVWVIGAILLLLLLVVLVLVLLRKRSAAKAVAVTAAAGAAVAGGATMASADETDDSFGLNSDEFDASEMEAAELLASVDTSQSTAEDDFSETIGGKRSKVNLPVEQIPALTDEDTSEFDAFVDKDEAPSPDVDYLTEADVYLRYGMEDEAEEQVGMALKLNKSDVQAHIKMLQIRHAKGEQSGINDAVAQARSALSGDDLNGFESEVGDLGIDASGVKAAISSEKTLEIDEDTDVSALNGSMGLDEMESTAEVDMGELRSGNSGGDLDFDIGDIDLGSVGTDAAMAAAASAGSSDDLDFDLGDIDLTSVGDDSASSGSASMTDDGDLDFDLGGMDLSSLSDDAPSSKPSASIADEEDDLDFDLGDMDLSSVSNDADAAPSAPEPASELDFDMDSLDMSGLDDDDDMGSASLSMDAPAEADATSDGLDFDFGDMSMDDDTSVDASDVLPDTSDSSDDAIDFDFDMDDISFGDDGDDSKGANLDLGSNGLDDDLAMLDMSFDDVPATLDDDEAENPSDETIVTDFSSGSGSGSLNDSDFDSLDFISTVTMENNKQSGMPLDLGGADIESSLDSMSLMVDDITPALQSMETDSVDDDELTKTLSTMSMLVDDMDTSEITIDMDDDDDDDDGSDALDLSLSTGDLDVSLQTRSALDDSNDPDLSSLLGELEEITGLNDIPSKS